jgi:hypothetical protein
MTAIIRSFELWNMSVIWILFWEGGSNFVKLELY